MRGKVKTYLKKGFLMLLVAAMVFSNSGISAFAATVVPMSDTVLPEVTVSDNSAEKPQAEEPQVEIPQAEEPQVEVVTKNAEVPVWEPEDVDSEREGDASKGIEYGYPTGSEIPNTIYLNGNSVIIRESATEGMIEIVLDTNRNGAVDAQEEETAADYTEGLTVCGVYQNEVKTPVRVTVLGGKIGALYGVRSGAAKVSGDYAIFLDVQGGTVTNEVVGVESGVIACNNSQAPGVRVSVTGGVVPNVYGMRGVTYTQEAVNAPALQMTLSGGTTNYVYGAQNGTITSDGSADTLVDMDLGISVSNFYGIERIALDAGSTEKCALDIDVTGDGAVTSEFAAVWGSGYSSELTIVGGIDINVVPKAGATEKNFSSSNSGYGMVGNYVVVNGDVSVNLKNVYTTSYLYCLAYAHVKGDFTFYADSSNQLQNYQYIMASASCDGKVKIDTVGASESGKYNYVYGAQSPYPNTSTVVGGDFEYNYNGGYARELYGIDMNGHSVSGDITVNVKSGTIGSVYGVDGITTAGNVSVCLGKKATADESAVPVCVTNSFNPISNSSVGGNVSYALVNNNADSNEVSINGLSSLVIGGNLDAYVEGGYYGWVYGLGSGSVQGNVNITWKDMNKDVDKEDVSGSFYGMYNTCNIGGKFIMDVTNCRTGTMYATSSGYYGYPIGGGAELDFANIICEDGFYGLNLSATGGDVICNFSNITAGSLYAVKQSQQNNVSTVGAIDGDIEVTMTDITCTGSMTGIEYIGTVTGDVTLTMGDNKLPEGEEADVLGAVVAGYNFAGVTTNNGTILGNLAVNIYETTVGTENSSSIFQPVRAARIDGTSILNIAKCEIYGNAQLYQVSPNSQNGDGTITVSATNFYGNTYGTGNFYISPSSGQKVTTTLDSDCSIGR